MSEHVNLYIKAVVDGTVIATRERSVTEEFLDNEENIGKLIKLIYEEDIEDILDEYDDVLGMCFSAGCMQPIIFEVFVEEEFIFGISYAIALTEKSTIKEV